MEIIIISAVYPPEPIVSAKTSASLTEELLKQNHNVTVLTNFPNRPSGKLYKGYKRALYTTEHPIDGLRVTRCYSTISSKSSVFSRWAENITFGVTSSLLLLFSPRPNVVYSNSWPIFATGFVSLVCKLRRIPLVVHVQDLYPESLSSQGRIHLAGVIWRLLMAFDRWISSQVAALIVLSDQHATAYTQARRINSSKVYIIPDWIDAKNIVCERIETYRRKAGILSGAFVIAYGGNVGKAAGVEKVIESLKMVQSTRETVFLVAGSGSQLAACQKLAKDISNVRIIFHSPWLPEETLEVLSAADVLLLPTRGNQSLASIPSKLLSYLLAAKPVLAMVLPESETAKVIEKSGCGWIIPPDNICQMAEHITELSNFPSAALAEMGVLGRQYALTNFTSESLLPKVMEILNKVARYGK